MSNSEFFGFEGYDEEDVQVDVDRYEKMVRAGNSAFFDLAAVENIYYHYLRRNEVPKALKLIDYALGIHPGSADLYYKRASTLFELGKYEKAKKQVLLALSLNPFDLDYIFLHSEILNQSGQYDTAILELEKAATFATEPEEVFFQMGTIAQLSAEYADAEKFFNRAIDANPELLDAVFELGYCYEYQQRFEDAIKLYERVLNQHPFSHFAWLNLGLIREQAGQFEKAIDAFDFALAIRDDFVPAYCAKGNVLLEIDRISEALKAYLDSTAIAKPDHGTMVNIAICYERMGNYHEALRYYSRCIDHAPEFAETWVRMGTFLYNHEKFMESISYFRKAVEKDEQHFDARFGLARAEFRLGNHVTAWEELEVAISIDPHDPEMWETWATMLREEGDTSGAIQFLRKGMQFNSDNAILYYQCSAYEFVAGRHGRAMTLLENALLMDAENCEVLFEIEPALREIPRVRETIRLFQKENC